MKQLLLTTYKPVQKHQDITQIENNITKMSTLIPPEDQPVKARSKSITLSQPQNATQLLSKTFSNVLQVSSPPKSKSMIDLSILRPETIAENNNLDPHSLVVMQVKNKHGDKYGRMESQESLNKAGA